MEHIYELNLFNLLKDYFNFIGLTFYEAVLIVYELQLHLDLIVTLDF
jgi:hypothetical protein